MKNPKELSDAKLVKQYQLGDNKALVVLVKRWHKKFCNHAYWYTKDSDLSKDIVQDSWAIIIVKIGTLKHADKFGSWGLTIVTRKAIDSINQQKKHQKIDSFTEVNLVDEAIKNVSPLHNLVKQEINNLPIEQQTVLKLFYVEGYKIHQIATILNIAKGTVKSRLFTAREKLKRILKDK